MLHSKFPRAINFTYGNVYVSRLFSQFVPPTSCPPVVHKSVYICVSIAALQIGSSVPSKCKLLCIAQQSIWPWPAFPALEKAMATHSSTLAWRILGMKEPDRLPSMRSHRVGHDWSDLAAAAAAAFPASTPPVPFLPCPAPVLWGSSLGVPQRHTVLQASALACAALFIYLGSTYIHFETQFLCYSCYEDISMLVLAAETKHHRQGGINNLMLYLLTVPEAGIPRSEWQHGWILMIALP